jgi:HPt (histidine-containing phosphotransfer) domain-containing protein
MVDLSVFDAAALLALVGDDKELMQEIVDLYLEEYPRILGDIRAAAASGEVRALEFSAHALKGSVSNMAARRAYDAAMELETLARADQLPGARDALPLLERELASLQRALQMTGTDPAPA